MSRNTRLAHRLLLLGISIPAGVYVIPPFLSGYAEGLTELAKISYQAGYQLRAYIESKL